MKKVLFILGELSDRDIEWMIAAGKRESISPGTVLIHQGQPVTALYIVLEGLLAVTVEGNPPRELARLGCGEIVGEMSFVDARPPSATVRALDETTLLSIPRLQLAVRLQAEPDFAARFYRALAMFLSDRLRSMEHPSAPGVLSDADELDPNVLDTVHLAGSRFDWMLKRLMSN
jgi:CRP/FNR family cyclic AMP-dependent transcriptional regulator